MKFRANLDFIGNGEAANAYGGKLDAWSFKDMHGEEWFINFKNHVLSCIGKRYLPIYRMADGEYRFLMGRKFNFRKKPLWRELIAVTAEKLKIKNEDKWKTSWGEEYSILETKELKSNLINQIKEISNEGYLACYINDNGLNAFTEYNKHIGLFFNKYQIRFEAENYIPFHFVVGLLVNQGWQEFYQNRNILIISGTDEFSETMILSNLIKLNPAKIEFLRISKTTSMKDKLDLSRIIIIPDIIFVAAGIGSANIITQLKSFNTVVLDIGGYINCFIDTSTHQHGGTFKYPLE